jgi:hypothetical protein
LKLQVTFHFWKLLIWLQNLQGRCLSWWIGLVWTWMKCLKPFLHLIALSWLHSWLVWASDDLGIHWWLWASTTWQSYLKMTLGSYKLFRVIMWPLSQGNTWTFVLMNFLDANSCGYDAMQYVMLMT